jgi:hypothetical protein
MAAQLTRLTHKIAIQLHLMAESCTICSLAPGGQSGNFWIHPLSALLHVLFGLQCLGLSSDSRFPYLATPDDESIQFPKRCVLM